MRRSKLFFSIALAALSFACSGEFVEQETWPGKPRRGGAQPEPGPGSEPQPGDPTPPPAGPSGGSAPGEVVSPPLPPPSRPAVCQEVKLAPRGLRRLTGPELEATVRAAFSLSEAEWSGPQLLPDPASADGFTNNQARLEIGEEYAKRWLENAKTLSDTITAPNLLLRVAPCALQGGEACARSYLDTVGKRLYRRPLDDAEKARYVDLLRKVEVGGDFKQWVYWATVALLGSPSTLYRSELGEKVGDRYRLTGSELASALSYTYTGGPPSEALLDLAATGRLETKEQIEAAARELVVLPTGHVQPGFRQLFRRFADQWLGLSPLANLSKDKTVFPQFTPEIQDALGQETTRFLEHVVFEEKGTAADLLTAPYTSVDSKLSAYYGFGQVAPGTFNRVQRPAGWGVGLLAQGSILALAANNTHTSPTKRGHLVRERILCTKVPPPPAVVEQLPEPTAGKTTRERYESLHAAADGCKGCHALMDPIGFAFEHLDAAGRYREREGQYPIDASGAVTGTSAGELRFDGPAELGQALARLPEAAECMGNFFAAYSFGIDRDEALCMAGEAGVALGQGGLPLVEFFVRLAGADSFRFRAP